MYQTKTLRANIFTVLSEVLHSKGHNLKTLFIVGGTSASFSGQKFALAWRNAFVATAGKLMAWKKLRIVFDWVTSVIDLVGFLSRQVLSQQSSV